MIELSDTAPVVTVATAEYRRLLGYPPGYECSERALELADWARGWYARNGHPWIYARQGRDFEARAECIRIEGTEFHSRRLKDTLETAGAHGAVLVAAGAGESLELEARRLWEEGKPDEYFFLEVYGSAVVEHLTHATGARLCAWAEEQGMAILPHYSPGYAEWDVSEQGRLLSLIAGSGRLPGRLEALPSGALRPKKSQLAVFGFTRHTERVRRLTELNPCESCPCTGCEYRRTPQRGRVGLPLVSVNGSGNNAASALNGSAARYTIRTKALERWARERLSLHQREDGGIEARFRYEGTTCTNMGRSLAFDYFVALDPADGYRIREQRCGPVPGDTGYRSMCRYLENPDELTRAIADEKPLAGRPLSTVLAWHRAECAPGCYCDLTSREHKWGIVLETVHYALAKRGYRL